MMKGYHNRNTKAMQGFEIQDHNGHVAAAASFDYKGFSIGFSSIGYDQGSCLKEICVFDKDNNVVKDCHSVEEAISHVDSLWAAAV